MTTSKHAQTLILGLKKLEEQIRLISGQSASAYVLNWISEAEAGCATTERFRIWLENQIDYYGPKDRSYTTYIKSLLA